MAKALTKVLYQTAEQVYVQFGLDRPMADDEMPVATDRAPDDFISGLRGEAAQDTALHFLSFALPKREAAWAACLCTRAVLEKGKNDNPAEALALQQAQAWVFEPNDANRRAAWTAAEAAGFDNPASWCALAVFWSGGSMAPEGCADVLPEAHLCGTAAIGAIRMALERLPPEEQAPTKTAFIEAMLDIAQGGNGEISL